MIQEFAQVMGDQLKNVYLTSLITPGAGVEPLTLYMFDEPLPGARGYPYVLIHPGRSDEDMLTSGAPKVEAFYLIEVVDLYPGTTQDSSVAQLYQQRPMQLADSIKELLRNDPVVRSLCLDFRCKLSRPTSTALPPAESQKRPDVQDIRQPLEIRATFNTNGGIYGYSLYGYSTYA